MNHVSFVFLFIISMDFTSKIMAQNYEAYSQEAFHYYMNEKNKKAYNSYVKAFETGTPTNEDLYVATATATLLNKKDIAFGYIEQLIKNNYYPIRELSNDQEMNNLRTDPRWDELLSTMEKKADSLKNAIKASPILETTDFEKIVKQAYESDMDEDSLFYFLSSYNQFPKIEKTGGFIYFEKEVQTEESIIQAPFLVYVPTNYEASQSHSLLLYLHGGVSSSYFPDLSSVMDNPFVDWAEDQNILLLLPMGNKNLIWWHEVGSRHILSLVNQVKKQFNISDNQVFISGFSDGGTVVSKIMNVANDAFAGGFILNGLLLLAYNIEETTIPISYYNSSGRVVQVAHTSDDQLFPIEVIREVANNIQTMNHPALQFREYSNIGHNFAYASQEIPYLSSVMQNTKRSLLSNELFWMTGATQYGKHDWIEINEIGDVADEKILASSLFIPDLSYGDSGVKVKQLINDKTVHAVVKGKTRLTKEIQTITKILDLQVGDIITRLNDKIIADYAQLRVLENSNNGNYDLTINRGGQSIALRLPFQFEEKPQSLSRLFPENVWVSASYQDNIFNLITSSRVQKVTLYLHPSMIDMTKEVIIIINDKEAFRQKIEINRDFMYENFLKTKDRETIWINRVVLSIH